MITSNELYDIGYVFTLIRLDVKAPINVTIIKKVIEAISNKEKAFQPNNIRTQLSTIIEPHDLTWSFVFINNYYTRPEEIIKNPNINQCLADVSNSLLELLINYKYEQAYCLVDVLQAMLQIMAECKGFITKSFWKTVIRKYRENWDKSFLLKYQKELTTKG